MRRTLLIRRKRGRVIVAGLIVLSVTLATNSARASKLPNDLDSLFFASDQIVEGRIVPPDRTDWWAVQVTRVLSGSFRVGQRIHPGNLFQHEIPGTGGFAKYRKPLNGGELVVLFMRDEPKLECVDAGMFLLVHGNACRFGIEEPLSTICWQPPRLTPDSSTFRELAVGVAERLPLAAQSRAMINAPLDSINVHNLLELMHRWARPPHYLIFPDEPDDGEVSAAIADRLATLNDPDIAYQAMDSAPFAFNKVFQTPHGRDFLLDKIIDPKEAIPRRRGIYEVHVRLMNGNTVVSEGHGFQTLLPQPATAGHQPSTWLVVSFWLVDWWNRWSGWVEEALVVVVGLLMRRRWLRSRRRVARFCGGRCHVCGYDVRASSGKCSECGTVIADSLRIYVLRRRLIRFVCFGAVSICAGLIVLFARSYYAGDVVTRTDYSRADTVYVTRGIRAIQWLTVGNDMGWIHLSETPADLPQSPGEAGSPAERGLLGLEYSQAGNMLVMPLWMPALAAIFVGLILFPLGKPVSIPRKQNLTSPQSA